MPIPVTPKPLYPNVPIAPGVPPVLRAAGTIQTTVVQSVSDAEAVLKLLGIIQSPQWGLFNSSGQPAFDVTSGGIVSNLTTLLIGGSQSVGDLEYRLDHRLTTAPQEQGSFLTYNKVSTPFSGRVTYIVSGLESQRSSFLQQVATVQASTDLLTLIMPEYYYPSCNVIHHDLRRSARNGVSMFAVDVWVEEVRITGTSSFSNTASPNNAGQVDTGTAQPQTPTSSQAIGGGQSNDSGIGTDGNGGAGSTVGVPSEPYYDDSGNQIGVAPSATPSSGPIVGSYANGQPVIGGSWQQGFYDSNLNWVHP